MLFNPCYRTRNSPFFAAGTDCPVYRYGIEIKSIFVCSTGNGRGFAGTAHYLYIDYHCFPSYIAAFDAHAGEGKETGVLMHSCFGLARNFNLLLNKRTGYEKADDSTDQESKGNIWCHHSCIQSSRSGTADHAPQERENMAGLTLFSRC